MFATQRRILAILNTALPNNTFLRGPAGAFDPAG
jgi:hypothetical protein